MPAAALNASAAPTAAFPGTGAPASRPDDGEVADPFGLTTPSRPAVMLGNSENIFPRQLAAHWRGLGMNVVLVTRNAVPGPRLADGTPVVSAFDHATRTYWRIRKLTYSPLWRLEQRLVPRLTAWCRRRTGRDAHPWEIPFVNDVYEAFPAARAVRAQAPAFVFAHEVTTYGPALARAPRGVPRILFPWGGDVFNFAETSPMKFALVRAALHAADLVVPSSSTAAEHIRRRFGVPADRVRAVSWGVDLPRFTRAGPERRAEVCARFGIDPAKAVVMNPRRFKPRWGCYTALEAFVALAREDARRHFVLLTGDLADEDLRRAKARLAETGLSDRFTLVEGACPLETCADLMSVSDVFVSLSGPGDMRSSSVLQAAASGAAGVIGDLAEYRSMRAEGFAAELVPHESVADVVTAARALLADPARRSAIVRQNAAWLAQHEDYGRQMRKLLELVAQTCARVRGRGGRNP